MNVYQNILKAKEKGEQLFAVLIDPDKFELKNTGGFIEKVNNSIATHIFVGGSIVDADATEALVHKIKTFTDLPIILFPGDVTQITNSANALLFLSLLSGRNADYLIGKHVEAVSKLRETTLEVIPTGYILIDGGVKTAVSRVTQTEAISRENLQTIVDTAKAGQLLGMQLMYLEAGSGASYPIPKEIIKRVKKEVKIPLIVGGGIKTKTQLNDAFAAGADLVVVGTAFEEDESFLNTLSKR
ncbi:geranylgeranylglyceryl/heptaprenylglyceryl phosphate synthase [Hyunsoonleella ulvae]|uniref:geranylgeranylglyceryl/heptaprenylglyceryl phosphate synthase n=1 Tax=Hyunsoonleella ulvae TaxID=2799948 RepID=UPI0019394A1C|nr:geranylgeranylglyceryl/heptaprenylglyceryl phosphate synthase [Hyunsoonleella ulvae]